MTASKHLKSYAQAGRNRVQGWLSRIDAEIFSEILLDQNRRDVRGGVAEIGVHHGKSFIPLCMGLKPGERAYCIDLFDDQHQNIDKSGEGDYAKFADNLKTFNVKSDNIVIKKGSSLDLTSDTILAEVGPIRFFSVDGGHWHDIVVNDLRIALSAATEDFVIAVDDILHKEWPEVTTGFLEWYRSVAETVAPFAISNGKIYVCSKGMAKHYETLLLRNRHLEFHFVKNVDFEGLKIPLISQNPRMGVSRLAHYVRTYHPAVFGLLREAKHRMKGQVRTGHPK